MAAAAQRVHFITGSDEFEVKEHAAALAKKLTPPGEWSSEVLDGWVDTIDAAAEVISRAMEGLQTVGMFGGAKLVWIKSSSFFADSPMGRSETVLERLESLIELLKRGLPEDITLLISAPGADKRRSAFKELSKLAKTQVLDAASGFSRGWEDESASFVEQFFAENGKKIGSDATDLLVSMCGADHRALRMESMKVLLFAWTESAVTVRHVAEIASASREETQFVWCDAVVDGQTGQAIELLRRLEFQQESAVGLMRSMASHARLLLQCRVLSDRRWLRVSGRGQASFDPEAEVILATGKERKMPHPFRLGRVAAQSLKRPVAYWIQFYDAVYDATVGLFETGVDPFDHLEMLVLRLHAIEVGTAR